MRLRQIEVFHAVYSSGSMTNAAKLLHVSQPSVSKVLAHAEQQLGYALFERIKGKLVPTPEAHRLFGHVSSVYQNVDELRQVARNLRSSTAGRIRIATTPAFGTEFLPAAVASFQTDNPDTAFEIETGHYDGIQRALLQSRIDIGLCFSAEATPGIADEHLADASFVVLAPASIKFPRPKVRIRDLAGLPFVGLNSRGPLGRLLTSHLESSSIELSVVAVTETYHVARALAAHGAGVTIVDAVTAASGGNDDLRAWPLDPALSFGISALHFADVPLSVGAHRFTEHLRTALAKFLASRSAAPASTT